MERGRARVQPLSEQLQPFAHACVRGNISHTPAAPPFSCTNAPANPRRQIHARGVQKGWETRRGCVELDAGSLCLYSQGGQRVRGVGASPACAPLSPKYPEFGEGKSFTATKT